MDTLDAKSEMLLSKIENSDLPEEEKNELCRYVLEAMMASVQPILCKYLDVMETEDVSTGSMADTVDMFARQAAKVADIPEAQTEIENALDALTVYVNGRMAKEGIGL